MEAIHGQIDMSKIKSKIMKARKPDGTIIQVRVINLEENNLQLNGKYISFKDVRVRDGYRSE